MHRVHPCGDGQGFVAGATRLLGNAYFFAGFGIGYGLHTAAFSSDRRIVGDSPIVSRDLLMVIL